MTDWIQFREEMPVTKEIIYLNHAAIGPLTQSAQMVWKSIIDSQARGFIDLDWKEIISGFPKLRTEIAQLIHASVDEIAPITTAAHGIDIILGSLNWHHDSSKGILLNDMEFTTNSFPYQQVARKYNLPLHVVKSKRDKETEALYLDLGDFESILVSNPIRLVVISHVQFMNGFTIDLQKLIDMTHVHGAMILVDAFQSVGALDVDVHALDVDFLISGGYKWCLGPTSSGFLFVRKSLIGELQPLHVGAFSEAPPVNMVHHEFTPHTSALRFTASLYHQCLALTPAIKLINDYGITNIEHRILQLTDYLVEQFSRHLPSIQLSSVRTTKQNKSGIVLYTFPDTIKPSKLVKKLAEQKIIVALRAGGLRFSPHCYNTEQEIDVLVTSLKSLGIT